MTSNLANSEGILNTGLSIRLISIGLSIYTIDTSALDQLIVSLRRVSFWMKLVFDEVCCIEI